MTIILSGSPIHAHLVMRLHALEGISTDYGYTVIVVDWWFLEFYVHAQSKVTSGWLPTLIYTHSGFILLPYFEIIPPAL